MKYKVFIMPEAASDLQRLAKNEPKAFAKANRFIEELRNTSRQAQDILNR